MQSNVDAKFAQIVSEIEPLEDLEAPSWGEFFGGVGIGLSIVGLVAAGAALT